MSDRIAVFNAGRIEQVGTPAEVYEEPASRFVAGFVGTSNLIEGRSAEAVLGRDELISVRPEKIRLADPAAEPGPGEHAVAGIVREVIYVGSATRYLVDLSVGGSLAAVEQNVDRPRTDASQRRGQQVMLVWNREFETRIGP